MCRGFLAADVSVIHIDFWTLSICSCEVGPLWFPKLWRKKDETGLLRSSAVLFTLADFTCSSLMCRGRMSQRAWLTLDFFMDL
eukprot:s909_g22.t1